MFLYTTDWHLTDQQPINRKDCIIEASFAKVEQVFKYAKKAKLPILHGGDLFHKPNVAYSVLNRFIELVKKYKVQMYVVVGNHDIIGSNIQEEGIAIQTLFKAQVLKPLTTLTIGDKTIRGISYVEEITKDVTEDIVIAHLPIVTQSVPYEHIPVGTINVPAELFFCGHIHLPFDKVVNKTRFINPGCLVRRSITEKDVDIKLVEYSNNEIKYIDIKSDRDTFRAIEDLHLVGKGEDRSLADYGAKVEELDIRQAFITDVKDKACQKEILRRLEKYA